MEMLKQKITAILLAVTAWLLSVAAGDGLIAVFLLPLCAYMFFTRKQIIFW